MSFCLKIYDIYIKSVNSSFCQLVNHEPLIFRKITNLRNIKLNGNNLFKLK